MCTCIDRKTSALDYRATTNILGCLESMATKSEAMRGNTNRQKANVPCDTTLQFRTTSEQKARYVAAAEKDEKTLSDWIWDSLVEELEASRRSK